MCLDSISKGTAKICVFLSMCLLYSLVFIHCIEQFACRLIIARRKHASSKDLFYFDCKPAYFIFFAFVTQSLLLKAPPIFVFRFAQSKSLVFWFCNFDLFSFFSHGLSEITTNKTYGVNSIDHYIHSKKTVERKLWTKFLSILYIHHLFSIIFNHSEYITLFLFFRKNSWLFAKEKEREKFKGINS